MRGAGFRARAYLHDVLGCQVNIGIRAHNAGILATQLHLVGGHAALLADADAGVSAGEADAVHLGVRGEVVSNL